MKLKIPSKNVRYSFTALALTAGLILAFAVLAGAVTYRIMSESKASSTQEKEELNVAQAASTVSRQEVASHTNPDTPVSNDNASPAAPAKHAAPAPRKATIQTASAVSPQQVIDNTCAQLESQLKGALQQVNDAQYAAYVQAKGSLVSRLLGNIFGDYEKEVDRAYQSYHGSVNSLCKGSVGKLHNSGCNVSQLKLNLQPR